jgi:hypothetical protein
MLHQSTAGQVAGPSTELELVNYGAGYAWLRPELDRLIDDATRLERDADRLLNRRPLAAHDGPESRRVALTQRGQDLVRRWRADAALFGRPWPTVAEADALAEVA